jgi:glycosyltransferase involved in cell wall biosynthesis
MSVPLSVFLPIPLTGRGVSYTCGMLVEGMANQDLEATIVTPRARWRPLRSVDVIEVLPSCTRYVPYRWMRNWANSQMERTFLFHANRFGSQLSSAYIWPDATMNTICELKQSGMTVFREMINCHTGTAKIILDRAYERLGTTPRHTITGEVVQAEKQVLEAVDYIFCPSPAVASSLLENGVAATKLLSTSYGWDPARLSGSQRLLSATEGITVVFVGSICVRKGAHLLLDYWARSGVKGRLVLAGRLEPVIKHKCAHHLNRKDVLVFDYIRDVGALYRSADIFVLPSLEEGSPMVTYEACGCGLPVVTTVMGAGGIVRDNCEGLVMDPYDGDRWIAAIRDLAENAERRQAMSIAATERALFFHWSAVAAQRRSMILDRVK